MCSFLLHQAASWRLWSMLISKLGVEPLQLWPHRLFSFLEGIEETRPSCPIFSAIGPNLRVPLNLTGDFLTEPCLSCWGRLEDGIKRGFSIAPGLWAMSYGLGRIAPSLGTFQEFKQVPPWWKLWNVLLSSDRNRGAPGSEGVHLPDASPFPSSALFFWGFL